MEEGLESRTKISEMRRNKNRGSIKETIKMSKFDKHSRKQKKLVQSKIAALISNIGKFIIYVRGIKKVIDSRDFKNISHKQFDLINDACYPRDCFEENKKKKRLIEIVMKKFFSKEVLYSKIPWDST
jgi:hypothetical protein